MANEKYGFIIHQEEWRMVREILSPEQIANSLFPVLDACLLADDPSEAIGDHIKKHLAARMFWDRNVRDIDRYESNLKANNERKRRFRELRKQEETERGGTQGNAEERNGTPRNGGNGHYTDTDSETDTDTKTNPNTKPKPNTNKTDTTTNPTLPPKPPMSESGSESADIRKRVEATGKLKVDPWNMTTDDLLYGRLSAATILRLAFGKGGWRKAVAQAGEDAVKELFLTFRSEMRAGEIPDNPAAAFTDRLADDLGVDFSQGATAKPDRTNGAN